MPDETRGKSPSDRTDVLPILPLRNSVLFPASVVPINVGRPRSVRLIEEALQSERPVIGIVTQRLAETEDPGWADLYKVGTAARILKVIKLGAANYSVVLQGLSRLVLDAGTQSEPYLRARVRRLAERAARDVEVDALAINLKETARQVIELQLQPNLPKEASTMLDKITDPGALADLVASNLTVATDEKQNVLEAIDVKARLRLCLQLLTRQLEVLKVKREISSMVQEEMGKNQREYVLRQQMRAIKEELGELEADEDDLDVLRERIGDLHLPPEVDRVAKKQLSRLQSMQPSSAEFTVTRTYLDWLIELPWKHTTPDVIEIPDVRRVLDEDHYDLEKVKTRIVEYIAVRKLKKDKKGPILCFIGPPGVGKTSLGRSIARAIGRRFVRASLGGVRDEAEIRGHRRTYVGSLPGRILQAMKKTGTVNPVFLLDEVDKMGKDMRGDPASALLEVLDPEQNHVFADHYLELPYDLSQVLFIATANQADTIPDALLDRMEVIEIPGYTREDKRRISRQHLVPKQLAEHGITPERLDFADEGIDLIIDSYTREAGVRNLEREIASVCRAIAVRIASGEDVHAAADAELVKTVLGPEKYSAEMAERTPEPGIATGLTLTAAGGAIMFVEAKKMPGRARLHLTGNLGGVMKESAETALAFVRSRAHALGIAEDFLKNIDVHLHIPGGATPKDGASAGITMFTALASMLSGAPVDPRVAMTGELTLRGAVLAVGGIKEKVLAAHRAGIRRVIIPRRNERDIVEISPEIREQVELVLVNRVDEVLPIVLTEPKEPEGGRHSSVPPPT
ncbi:MAG: endopeptidase La [Deltaproteobacteria bacterium]|nr:endopeptidase La [Deltaproteobacteria bacterium]